MISIAMATYNGAKYIREQIDSIRCQTLQDFELVICDDCSTDETWAILENYTREYSFIRIYRNEQNLGFKKNFERVISLCKGDYIALSDQDDIWLPTHLEALLAKMTSITQLVCGKPLFVDEQNRELPKSFDYIGMYNAPLSNEDIARHILLGRSSYQGASMLIRKSFFDLALPIPAGAKYHDSWFALLACFTGGLVYVNKPTMRYRRLQSSVTYESRKVSAFRRFIRHIIHGNVLQDRLSLIQAVRNRVPRLNPHETDLLITAEKMHKRQHCIMGRIANIPYRLYHFKAIYACDAKNLFS